MGDKLGDKGDKSSGRHTIQHRETKRETMGDNPKPDAPSNKGKQEGTQGETRPWEGGLACGETMTDNWRQWET